MKTLLQFVGSMLVASLPLMSVAGDSQRWQLAGEGELSRGETDGTRVNAEGEVELGRRGQKMDLDGIGLVWCAARDREGAIYLGTGYDGKILRIRSNKVEEIATTGQLVVTSLLLDKKGDLFASTLPDPVIWKVANPAKISAGKPVAAEKWVTLPDDTKHIWTLEYDSKKSTIYAGTGPEGKLFALGRDKKPQILLDSSDEHILSVALGQNGKLYAGTSPEAILLESTGPGKVRAIYDFEGTEVKAIIPRQEGIYVAVNKFATPPAVPTKKNSSSGTKGSGSSSNKGAKAGDGKVVKLSYSGESEILWEEKKSHVASLAMSKDFGLFLGLGVDGKVLSIDQKRHQVVELDLDERQALALLADEDLFFVGAGDAGAAYRVERARQADAVYFSPVLDAATHTEWGRLKLYTKGKLKVQARSGNTRNPDDYWSGWSRPLKDGEVVSSPAGRYLQFRFSWAGDPRGKLVSAEMAFRSQNRRAVITEFKPGSPFSDSSEKPSEGDVQLSKRVAPSLAASRNDKEIALSWKVDNPDGDTLRIQLWYRALGERVWRPITKTDRLYTATRYTWSTESVPEGLYQVRLLVDDSPENDPAKSLSDEAISVPVLVDNHQPEIQGLSFRGGRVKGSAVDGFSEISALEYTVDSGPWMPLFSRDGVFDEKKEDFEFKLPDDLDAGPHAVGVRTYDRAGNMGTGEIHVETK